MNAKEKITIESGEIIATFCGKILRKDKDGKFVEAGKNKRYFKDADKYKAVSITVNEKFVTTQAHRLVWITFNGSIPNNLVINHKNLNKSYNALPNLEMITHAADKLHCGKLKTQKSRIEKFFYKMKIPPD